MVAMDVEFTNSRVMRNVGFSNHVLHNLDTKKRLTIPSDWREMIEEPRHLQVVPSVNRKCLCVYPSQNLHRKIEKLKDSPASESQIEQLVSDLFSHSDRLTPDGQGRIRISDNLLSFAEIGESAMMAGSYDHFKLFNEERWNQVKMDPERQSTRELWALLGM